MTRCDAPKRNRTLRLALLGVALTAFPLSGFICDDEPEVAAALPGAREGFERWVVFLKGDGADLSAVREESKKGASQRDAAIKTARAAAAKEHAAFEKRLAEFDGKIVEHWWMTNAVTVEIPAGAAKSIGALETVGRIVPDAALD